MKNKKKTLLVSKYIILIFTLFISHIVFSQDVVITNDGNIEEGNTTEITATLDAISSTDTKIPFTFSGDALLGIDYNVAFNSLGEETLVLDQEQSNYGTMKVLPNGNLLFFQNNTLRVYDPVTKILTTKNLSNYYSSQIITSGNSSFYVSYNNKISKIDFSDLDNITETIIVNINQNFSLDSKIHVTGDTLYYSVNNYNLASSQNSRYKKVGDADPVIIYNGNDTGSHVPVFVNDKLYYLENYSIKELSNGTFINSKSYSGFNIRNDRTVVYNNQIYVLAVIDGESVYKPGLLNIDGDQVTFEALPITVEDNININYFGFDSTTGNLITNNQGQDAQFNTVYSVSSYQLAPEIKIAAGETTGEITITSIDDEIYEDTESIIATPGTPTNATLSDNSPINLEITDNDDLPEITFELSSPTIDENSINTVTLTATNAKTTGVAITIPFTISGTATITEEFTVSATEITISAGATSGSVTISTENLDDTDVEIQETIIFTFGELTNATSSTTDVTLNLVSDDDPEVTSIASNIATTLEDAQFVITATINGPSAKDVTIPISLTGEALFDIDYNVAFDSQGKETLVLDQDSNYGTMKVLPNGNLLFFRNSTLRIYDPITKILTRKNLSNYYSTSNFVVSGNTTLYVSYDQKITKIDFLDLDNITETVELTISSNLGLSSYFNVIDDTIYYSTYNPNITDNRCKTYKKTSNGDELIYESNSFNIYESKPIFLNNKLQFLHSRNIYDLVDGNIVNQRNFSGFSINTNTSFLLGNEIYATSYQNTESVPGKLILNGSQITFEAFPITEEDNINYFGIDSTTGNLITLNQGQDEQFNTVYSVSSYQLAPAITIVAGETTGIITITSIDDEIYEETESIIATPGIPTNATIASEATNAINLEITDNDELPEITFELSSPTIDENSSNTVTLTATNAKTTGVAITIPFTVSGTATLTDEFTVSATEITIPAGETSGSVTISTEDLDDDEVEIQETIIFTFGELTNATSSTTDVTLNLVSDDDPEITSIVADDSSIAEDGLAVITATINNASGKDATVPISLTGQALFNIDYNVAFDALGEETKVLDIGTSNYGSMNVLPNGNLLFFQSRTLRIYDPITKTLTTKDLSSFYFSSQIITSGNSSFYILYNNKITKIDFTDLDNITETVEVSVSSNLSLSDRFNVIDDAIYYSIYNGNITDNRCKTYKKTSNGDELIYESNSFNIYESKPIFLNNKLQFLHSRNIYDLVDGNIVNQRNFSGFSINTNTSFLLGNEIYATSYQNTESVPGKLILNGSQITFEAFPITEEDNINYFGIDSTTGNLITLNQGQDEQFNTVYSVSSYQLAPAITIVAGETTGIITITSIDDEIYEETESIIATPGIPTNATIASEATNAINLEITDNDELPEITFELSSPTIDENSSNTVTLTATNAKTTGVAITIPFTVSGTATLTDEFTVSATEITIPAGETSGSVTISTEDLDDDEVEIQETIIFTFGELTNATSSTTDVTLNLVSDDDPVLTTITASKTEFAEHESSTITATIDQAASKDVSVQISLEGTATSELDYTVDFASKGEEFLLKNLSTYIRDFAYLDDGRLITLEGSNVVKIHNLDDTVQDVDLSSSFTNEPNTIVKDAADIYIISSRQIAKLNTTTLEITADVVPSLVNTSEYYRNAISIVNGKIFYLKRDQSNNNIIYSKEENSTQVEIASIQQSQSYNGVAVDNNERIYIFNSEAIYTLNDDNTTFVNTNAFYRYSSNFNNSLGDVRFINNILYAQTSGYNYNTNEQISKIIKFNSSLSAYEELELKGDINYIQRYNFTNTGDLAISTEGTNNSTIIKGYQIGPRITILAGQTKGSLVINGLEDELNSPGEEDDETIILNFSTPINAIAQGTSLEQQTLTLLNNELSLNEDENALVNVPPLSSSSVAWGDFDSDGDQDMAIMGIGLQDGIVTRLYENVNGVFEDTNQTLIDPRYEGDLIWVDYNKDGFIDLIVSGLDTSDNPSTTIYQNINGVFTPSTELVLPNLFGTSMDSGDLDNDGDIDFIINGMEIVNGVNVWKKYIYLREGDALVQEENFNNQFNETGVRNGSVKIADIEFDGDLDIIMVGESGSKVQKNTFIKTISNNNWWNYGNVSNLNNSSMTLFGNYIYYMGKSNENNNNNSSNYKIYRRSLISNQEQVLSNIEGLTNGDIALGDYDNDGAVDLVITGENENAESITKLYNGISSINMMPDGYFTENTEISLKGLRNSTAKWVDYDLDGDLDLFLTGTSDEGEFAKLYKTDLKNKNNTAPEAITGLQFEDLKNGKVKLTWDVPNDDFSTSLGYIIRLGTTEGGSEISNTESNLENGQRLITKSPVIYNNSYETILDPGVYYWSVQSVDDGLKGSSFSQESSFVLTYEWKELNQGGIIDRSINAVNNPIVKLSDIDLDNDMDLIYGSGEGAAIQLFTLGKKKFKFIDNISGSNNISDIKFLDFNRDKIQDIIINTWNGSNNNSLKIYNTNRDNLVPQEVFSAPGLYQSKIELIDINNDGLQEIVHIGRTNAEANSQLKVYVYEQNGQSLKSTSLDISSIFNALKSGAYGFGNVDNDEDIDFAITGLSNQGIQSNLYLNETLFTKEIQPAFNESDTELPRAEDSTLDFFDFDGDGDLDIALTGQGIGGPMFKILENNGLTGDALSFDEVQNTGLIPIREAKLAFGDYNSDGYLDILYSGKVSGQGQVTKLVEYDSSTKSYIESDFDLSDILNASIAFGDLDGDNDLDFTIAGETSSTNENIIRTFLNVSDESALVLESNNGSKTINLGQKNTGFNVNKKPTKPVNLQTEILGFDGSSETYKVKFSWDAATDDTTPNSGLTYALKIGTTENGDDIMSSNSLENGYRLEAGKGNVEHKLEWVVNLPNLPNNNKYYWSTQAIDASYTGSEFSEVQSIDVNVIKLGDSNGSLGVDVLDLIQNVDYILGKNPNPFVFEAADINNDQSIDVLDIVGIVDIILNGSDNEGATSSKKQFNTLDYYSNVPIGDAIFTWEGNSLYVNSDFDIGGLQLSFDKDFEYELSSELSNIDNLEFIDNDSKNIMLYSFDNKVITNGKIKLLTRTNLNINFDLNINKTHAGTISGGKLKTVYSNSTLSLENNIPFKSLNIYPNPSNGNINIYYNLSESMDNVEAKVYDITGRLVWKNKLETSSGDKTNKVLLNNLKTGTYIIELRAIKNNRIKYRSHKMLILK